MAIMTKVGIYVILRLSLLVLGPDSGPSAGFGAPALMITGVVTMGFGMIGILGTPELGRKGGYLAIISSGTVLAAIGFAQAGGGPLMLGGALYYMIGSTAAISAFFLIAEPVSRGDQGSDAPQSSDDESEGWAPMGLDTVDDVETPASTRTVSWLTMAVCFGLVAAMLAGLPPLPGFIGKFAILRGAVEDNLSHTGALPAILWVYAALLILSGLGALIALMRFGIRRFWAEAGPTPRILALEVVPVVILLAMIALQTLRADALLSYTRATAVALLKPATYRDAVLKNAQDVRAAPVVNLAPEQPGIEVEVDP
jgi:multicomponent K+:H+ antiporter subunit D